MMNIGLGIWGRFLSPMVKKYDKLFFLVLVLLAALGQYEMAQARVPSTLGWGIALFAVAVILFIPWADNPLTAESSRKPLGFKTELAGFMGVMAIAAFFRFYKLNSIPSGLSNDQAFEGFLSLEVLKGHFRPLWEVGIFTHPALLLYQLALWHSFFQPSVLTFYSFYAVLSLVSFGFIYWTFRQMAGARAALLTLYFLAIMRWEFNFVRGGFPSIQVSLYVFGTLAFLQYGLRTSKWFPFLLGALFLSAGLYGYQAFRIFPLLLLAYLVFDLRNDPSRIRANRPRLLAGLLLCAALVSPLVFHWLQIGGLGTRESESFVGKAVLEQKSLNPILEGVLQTALMFNRRGEEHPRFNFEDHRYFDDVTGIFFVLGFLGALVRWREKPHFYSLAGFAAMILPGILSAQDIPFSHRMIGAAPFAAYFAASAWRVFYLKTRGMGPFAGAAAKLLLLLSLAGAGVENWKAYFVDQASSGVTRQVYDPQDRRIGEAIAQNPQTRYFLAPAFYSNYAVRYLAYNEFSRVKPFNWLSLKEVLRERFPGDACFILDPGKKPTLQLLEAFYPGGQETTLDDKDGTILAHYYRVPLPLGSIRPRRGLVGEYFTSGFTPIPLFRRLDPLLNFTDTNDFILGQHSAAWVRWTGKIMADSPGPYRFFILTSNRGRLWVDRQEVVDTSQNTEGMIRLTRGSHDVILTCVPGSDPLVNSKFDLLWKKPGHETFEVIPNPCFGEQPQ